MNINVTPIARMDFEMFSRWYDIEEAIELLLNYLTKGCFCVANPHTRQVEIFKIDGSVVRLVHQGWDNKMYLEIIKGHADPVGEKGEPGMIGDMNEDN